MSRIARFIKTAGVYFIGNVLTKLVSFFLLPLYTAKIDPEAYGEYGLVISIINVVVPIVFFSIWDGVFRFSFDFEDENKKFDVLNNGFIVIIFGSMLLLGGALITNFIIDISNIMLILGYALAMGIQYYYTVIARALKDNTLFVISGLANSIFSMTLNVILIVAFGLGVESLYISYIAGVCLQIIIIEFKKHFLRHISLKSIKKSAVFSYVKFSLPVTVSSISNWLLNGLTQLYITYKLGSYYNGQYNVANKFSSILILAIGMFQFAWYEMAYDLANDGNKEKYYKKSISEILRFSLIGVSALIVAVKIAYPVMVNEQYNDSLAIIPVLLIGTMANAYAGFVGTLFLADKKSFDLFTTTLIAGIVNAVGLVVLTKLFGFFGSVLSLCIAFISYAIIRIVLLKRRTGITLYSYSFLPVFVLAFSVVAFYLINSLMLLIGILLLMLIVSAFLMKDMVIVILRALAKKTNRRV